MKISDFLKQETKELHQISEALVIKYIRNMASKEDYIRLLTKFYVFNKEIHQFTNLYVQQFSGDYPFFQGLVKINQDFVALNLDLPNMKQREIFKNLHNDLHALSIHYVLQGSSLGRPYIAKILNKLDFVSTNHYFNEISDIGPQDWNRFKSILNSNIPIENRDQAVSWANLTFKFLIDLFRD
ncbi:MULTISPECIES: biliverdin-producing heme oxygenase [Sphingobacterium]|uniref:biliverdin-producing heme oxygenase n=1 Tax=Sphingobacterium TaxID=28453 RepID=UPI00240D0AA5|nr:biliverdin-producing heme oxygenase [Sphingobacterium sp. WM]WFB63439.1 biliverdin-producing heme oxygenase [Sphingobacterium sp. WM]